MPHQKIVADTSTNIGLKEVRFDLNFTELPAKKRHAVCTPNAETMLDADSWVRVTSEFTRELLEFLKPAGVTEVCVSRDYPFVVEIVVPELHEPIALLRLDTYLSNKHLRRQK